MNHSVSLINIVHVYHIILARYLPPAQCSGERYYLISPPTCLERGVEYKIRIDFQRYRSDRQTPEASILVDSVRN